MTIGTSDGKQYEDEYQYTVEELLSAAPYVADNPVLKAIDAAKLPPGGPDAAAPITKPETTEVVDTAPTPIGNVPLPKPRPFSSELKSPNDIVHEGEYDYTSQAGNTVRGAVSAPPKSERMRRIDRTTTDPMSNPNITLGLERMQRDEATMDILYPQKDTPTKEDILRDELYNSYNQPKIH